MTMIWSMLIEVLVHDVDTTPEHAHGAAEADGAGFRRCELDDVVTRDQVPADAQGGDHEAGRAGVCVRRVDLPDEGDAFLDGELVGIVSRRPLLHAEVLFSV